MKKPFIVVFISLLLEANIVANSNIIGLSEAYKMALVNEAKLKSVGLQAEAKVEDIKQVESQLYPQISASLDTTFKKYTNNYDKKTVEEEFNSGSLIATQVVYHPEILTQIESAKLQADAAQISYSKEEQGLAYKVADAYISILKYQNGVTVAESYVKTNATKHQQIAEKFALQLANKMDFLESKLAYEEAQIILHKQQKLLSLSKLKLKNLTGADISSVPSIEFDTLKIEDLKLFSSMEDLQNNPDIKIGKIGTQIYEKEVETSKYGHYPKLDLVLSHTKYDTKDITVDYTNDSKIMLELKIPLYQGGKVSSQIEKNRLLLLASKEALIDQERSVKVQYEELLLNYSASIKDVELQKNAKNSAILYLHSVEKGYEHGLKNLIDLEDARTKLFEAKFKLIDSTYTLINSYIGLLSITGKLSLKDMIKLDTILFSENL